MTKSYMNSREAQQYDLGRQARKGGYSTDACNITADNYLRGWWLAGWHDQDMEMKALDPVESMSGIWD